MCFELDPRPRHLRRRDGRLGQYGSSKDGAKLSDEEHARRGNGRTLAAGARPNVGATSNERRRNADDRDGYVLEGRAREERG